MDYLLDTNAIIYLLKGKTKPPPFTNGDDILISFITKIELLSYKTASATEKENIEKLLGHYRILLIDDDLIDKTIEVRKNFDLKLPDSIIVATAMQENATLITSDKQIVKKAADFNIQILDPLAEE